MLAVAGSKGTPAELVNGSCDQTPFSSKSFDLILVSFILSYIEDSTRLAVELSRIAKDDCDLFLSDMHPDTERRLGWKRSFTSTCGETTLRTQQHGFQEIARAFSDAGWTLQAALLPEFGTPEREVFAAMGRLDRFHEAEGRPAIYIFHLHKAADRTRPISEYADHRDVGMDICLSGGHCALGPDEVQMASLGISQGTVTFLASDRLRSHFPFAGAHCKIDLSGYLLLPGLVNAHDHLEFSLFPRLASRLYENATEWAEDVHERFNETIALHRSVPLSVRVWWGGVRNLLSGVTTVCHHNPWLPDFEDVGFPVRVIRRYGWAHSIRFGGDLRAAYTFTSEDAPFVVHACEGIDAPARAELDQLDRFGVLNHRTVLVHGLALTEQDADVLRNRGISLIICPSSNWFLFGEVPSGQFLQSFSTIALGSDSPLTGCGNLLDEVQFAARHCALSPQRLYSMVTDRPAAILGLRSGEGSIRISARADLVAVRNRDRSPAETLSTLSAEDVELVVRDGSIHLASQGMYERLPGAARHGLEPISVGGIMRWLRAPVKQLVEDAERVLGKGAVKLSGIPVCIPPQPSNGQKLPMESANAR
jgi:cytosine/adenosine deaminase-related metal-dependent hydrolase